MFRALLKPEIICTGINVGIQAIAATKVAEYFQKQPSPETSPNPPQAEAHPEEQSNQPSVSMRR